METSTYNIALIGDATVGKTTFLTRHATGEFIRSHSPTVTPSLVRLVFYTNEGIVRFNVWEGGNPTVSMDGIIFMFDVTQKQTRDNLKRIIPTFHDLEIPTSCIVGNKVDRQDRMRPSDMNLDLTYSMRYFGISSESNYNCNEPFLYLMRQLLDDDYIVLIDSPAVTPPTVA